MGSKGVFMFLLIVAVILFVAWPSLEILYYRLMFHLGLNIEPETKESETEEKENEK